jgi:GNAT superfamily N-acetyltransferase
MEIRALRETDDRAGFRSGEPDLDRFFTKYAGQNQFRHHIGTTYVALERGLVLGLVTVSAGAIEIDRLPETKRKKLPRYPLAVLRLGRLAVAESAQGRGVGKALLRFVLQLASRMAPEIGCVGVVVDAKPDAVGFYQALGFIALDVVEGGSEARPAPTSMFLSLAEVPRSTR